MTSIITRNLSLDYGHEPFFKKIIVFGLLTLTLTTATEVFSRLGLASIFWVMIYAGSAIYILLDQKQFLKAVMHSWPVLLLPFYALLSVFWSAAPQWSLTASIQLFITTLIAIWIGSRFSAMDIFKSLLLATAFGVLISILNDYLHFVKIPPPIEFSGDEMANTGIFRQKNVYGKTIVLLALCLIIVGIRYKKLPIAIFFSALLWIPLSSTQSVGSILIYLATMLLPILWWLSRSTKKQFILFMFSLVFLFMIIFLVVILDIGLVDNVLQGMGKDSTLTGRTLLWSIGIDVFEKYSLTGVGYQAFWQPGAFDQVAVIHAMFNGQPLNGFHSAFIEVMVALGVFGLCIFIYLLLATIFRAVICYKELGTVGRFGVVFFVLSSIVAATFDVILFRQHEIFYILMVTFYVMSGNLFKNESRKEGKPF